MSVKDRVKNHRAHLRAQGLRPVQVWVPDVRRHGFDDEATRQAALLAANDEIFDDQQFVEEISDDWGEE